MYSLLIVDDEAELRNGIANYFPWHEFGFEVSGLAEDGIQALEIIKNSRIDVVLTDIMMPNMDGIELAKNIHTYAPSIKILFLSGYQEFTYAQRAIEYNVTQYIVKPVKYNQLNDIFTRLKKDLDHRRGELSFYDHNDQSEMITDGYYRKLIQEAKAYIKEHYRDVTLEDVAAHVNLNPYYLSNLFKLQTGVKYSDYVTKIKMLKAAELLQNINLKVYDISFELGYSNPNNFSRAFKVYFNKTPKEYRKDMI